MKCFNLSNLRFLRSKTAIKDLLRGSVAQSYTSPGGTTDRYKQRP